MLKILLVDDESLILHSLGNKLRQEGALVSAVANGTDALREIRCSFYDICFLDVNLPDANGLDLMKIIQKESPATSIIIMTANLLSDSEISNLHKNNCQFVPKPFDLDEVLSLVADISRDKPVSAAR